MREAEPVLPCLDVETLCVALRRLPAEELGEALQSRLLPVGVRADGALVFAACAPDALAHARRAGLPVIARTESPVFAAAAQAVHGRMLARQAERGLARRWPEFSASRRLTPEQAGAAVLLLSLAFAAVMLAPAAVLNLGIALAAGLFFTGIIAIRMLCLMPAAPQGRAARPLNDAELPGYTVLVPLFRETAVLDQLTAALAALDYPPDKLDIKLLLEEDDMAMRQAVARLTLPPQFEVLTVPAGKPQTKPRALNYGLAFARGTLLTIFDAEDIPEPDQLRKAASCFAAAGDGLACLQAKLTFYNPHENWLARQFTAEYEVLFGLLLPTLAELDLPLPLGGTSNHFRIAALRQAGGWDAFNVTEDADLGLRLARFGFSTATLASRTYEEANLRLPSWIRQRARWLKGFLATWLVHMRDPLRLWRETGAGGFWAAQAMTFGVFASALLHPVCLAATLVTFTLTPAAPPGDGVSSFAGGLSLFVLLAGHGTAMAAGWRGLGLRRDRRGRLFTVLTMPVYWLLLSAAAWLALWQFITAPWHWNKTEHGFSAAIKPHRKL